MKARYLKKLLNDTRYNVHIDASKVCVGSTLCHDLISVDIKSMKIKYAMDTWNKGRHSLDGKDELANIWDILQSLIDSGHLNDIIDGKDEIENPLPVFYVDSKGVYIETTTDAYGWPNVTAEGILMYNGGFFDTAIGAIENGIENYKYFTKSLQDQIEERENEIRKRQDEIVSYEKIISDLQEIKTKKSKEL